MAGLMVDVIKGSVDPKVANAACNVAGKMLKAVDMQLKYGESKVDDNLTIAGKAKKK